MVYTDGLTNVHNSCGGLIFDKNCRWFTQSTEFMSLMARYIRMVCECIAH